MTAGSNSCTPWSINSHEYSNKVLILIPINSEYVEELLNIGLQDHRTFPSALLRFGGGGTCEIVAR
jgi:hypothetical protein